MLYSGTSVGIPVYAISVNSSLLSSSVGSSTSPFSVSSPGIEPSDPKVEPSPLEGFQ